MEWITVLYILGKMREKASIVLGLYFGSELYCDDFLVQNDSYVEGYCAAVMELENLVYEELDEMARHYGQG